MNKKEAFWHSVPRAVVYRYVKDKAFVEKAKRLVKEGKETTSFGYAKDLAMNPKRFAYYLVHMPVSYTHLFGHGAHHWHRGLASWQR